MCRTIKCFICKSIINYIGKDETENLAAFEQHYKNCLVQLKICINREVRVNFF